MTRIAPSAVSPKEKGVVRRAYADRTKTKRSNQYHARNPTPITEIRRGAQQRPVKHAVAQAHHPIPQTAPVRGGYQRGTLSWRSGAVRPPAMRIRYTRPRASSPRLSQVTAAGCLWDDKGDLPELCAGGQTLLR